MSIEGESFTDKLWRKCSQEPFVPIGCLVTVGFLVGGLKSFRNGQTARSQLYMRGRVVAQALTIVAVSAGALMGMKPHDRPVTMEEKMVKMETEKQEYFKKYGEDGK